MPGRKLTSKQERFVQGLVSGLTQRQAFIKAGYTSKGKSGDYLDNEAWKKTQLPQVRARYKELMEEHKNKALWTREEAINSLKWLHDQAIRSIQGEDEGYVRKGTSDALINAIQELNKLEDLYPAEKIEQTNRNIELDIGEWDDDDD
ncbi:Terminase small subunit [Alloiococcus otitis]|uniref:Terminase small subunit n=1 Tax=Alloiococcus otitis ATCC 51267 TaxID=883081 RepID=K9EUL0_9LACT|nr:terminase small subunit [Alloiococcus otitis]EKU92850.1 hypothetical protein HMPREF9698_01603 [Alloiococcus otitis ATCC 51267]SUU80688.1 Terminase small subunit [Alloiococcus otitis]SUU91684.1 Terminase small subunit [Alloiococcus otitis]